MQFTEIRLATSKLQEQYRFYSETLGFEVTEESSDAFAIHAGDTKLVFEQVASASVPYHFAFNIPHNQFQEAKSWLADRVGLVSIDEKRDEIDWVAWDARACYFKDPAGNIGELIARFKLSNASEQPFSAHSITRISEIGVAVDDVVATSAMIQAELEVKLWDGGDEIFAAIGDAEGLMILVRKGRAWFPTSDAFAMDTPTTITIRGNEQKTIHIPGQSVQIQVQ